MYFKNYTKFFEIIESVIAQIKLLKMAISFIIALIIIFVPRFHISLVILMSEKIQKISFFSLFNSLRICEYAE